MIVLKSIKVYYFSACSPVCPCPPPSAMLLDVFTLRPPASSALTQSESFHFECF